MTERRDDKHRDANTNCSCSQREFLLLFSFSDDNLSKWDLLAGEETLHRARHGRVTSTGQFLKGSPRFDAHYKISELSIKKGYKNQRVTVDNEKPSK